MSRYRLLPIYILFCIAGSLNETKGEEKEYFQQEIPENWKPVQSYYQTSPVEDRWWDSFQDPVLTELIERAVEHNYNVAVAMKNINMASLAIKQTRSGYSPTFDATAGWTRSKEAGAIRGESFTSSYFSLGISVNWEIDVFGRIRQQLKEKKAAYEVARTDFDAVTVSLCASLATAYMQLRTYEEELRVAKEHIESQKYICKITEARFEAQLASMLDVTQARVVLYQTESSLPELEANIRVMKNTISLLCGCQPGQLDTVLEKDPKLPRYEQVVSLGVPAELLRRRPDIVEAEMELEEYAAMIGIAKKEFLPTLSLTGDIGTYGGALKDLFGKNSLGYSIAPQLSWTIFEGLSRNYAVAEAKLQFESAIDQYNQTVLTAFEEVDNALAGYAGYLKAIELQQRVVEASKKSLDLSFELYKSGLTMFSNVVDSEIDWLTSQTTLIEMQGNALSSLIDIYKALGGGWENFNIKN